MSQKRFLLRESSLLLLIIAFSVLLRCMVALIFANQVDALPGIYDQISYHQLALRVVDGFGFTFSSDWWPASRAGVHTAFWSYLYTIYLSACYVLFGAHPFAPRLIQAILAGALMPLLVYRISVQTFKRPKAPTLGLISASWISLYPYFLYYSASLMTETFYILGILWTLDCALRIAEQSPFLNLQFAIHNSKFQILLFLELGLAVGLTTLLRQIFLLFLPFLFLWLLWSFSRERDLRPALWVVFRGGLLSVLVVALCIAPFTLLNYQRFGRFVLLNTNSGYAFFWANHPIYGDRFVPILTEDMPSYQELIPPELRSLDEAALDQALLKQGLGFVVVDPGRYLRLSLSRIPAYFIFWPLPQSSLPSNLTRVLSFGLALPFMLLGVVLWIFDLRKRGLDPAPGTLLLLFTLVYSAIHLLSWALIRYRLPVDAVMLVFAARGIYKPFKRLTLES
jgi:hypothetical protein